MNRRELSASRYELFREPALQFIHRWARSGQVLVIGATRAAADEWAREACEDALLGVHRMTLPHLAAALSAREMALAGSAPVTGLVVAALAARVTDLALRQDALRYFQPVARMPGFATALAATLAELRLDHIAEDSLAAAGGPGADLAALLRLYQAELRERGLVDLADQLAAAIRVARAGTSPLCGLPMLLVDAPCETALERELVEALAGRAAEVLTLKLGPSDLPVSTSLESLQRYLFAAEVPAIAADDSVEVFSASGEALECVEIARRALAAAGQGMAFDRMAVLLRSPERYQPLVEEGLRRAGVPAYFSRGGRRPYVSGRAFLALLECAREGLSASRFAEYLSLGQTPFQAPPQWERLLVDASVAGGLERWKRRLSGLAELFRMEYQASADEAERAVAEQRILQAEALAEFALPVIERLDALPRSAAWRDWLGALDQLAQQTLRFPEAVTELLDELAPMGDIGPVDLSAVLLVLEPRLRALRQPPKGPRYGRVFVAPIEEARGMSFDVVFLPGLNEGSFPRPPAEDPLLLDERRSGMAGARPRAREDHELLSIAAACARSRLVVSYSRLDLVTGRQRVPSFYVFETLRAARGQGVDVREIEREAERGAHTRVGWPAPPDPADAIDDAEYDLATLRPAFDMPDPKGIGAYLTKINPHLVRSLRSRGRRWRRNWYREDGLTGLDIHELQILERYRLGARPLSVTTLEEFAVCPYRFALRAIHKLHAADHFDRVQRMDPAIRGQIYHRVQYEVLRELQQEGRLPVQPDGLKDAWARLDAALDRVSAEFAERLAPAIPHVWAAEVESLRVDLHGWLQQSDPAWTPSWFELAFGLENGEGHDPASVPDPVAVLDGSLLRGSIDLIERHASGALRVTDHKTGSLPKKKPETTGFGEKLQPVLYALAAEKVLGMPVALGRLYYATLRQNFKVFEVPVNDWSRQQAGRVLRIVDDAIHNGFLPAAPREDACRRCDYLPVCGPYEQERIGKKPTPELKALVELRRMA